MPDILDMAHVRSQFPGMSNGWVLMDNAGGTQILQSGIDGIADYLRNAFVQLGGSYDASLAAERRVDEGRAAAQLLMNARRPEEIVFGPSTSVSLANLAKSMRSQLSAGDEIILTQGDHESNIGVWERLQDFGVVIRFWPIDKATQTLKLHDLDPLLNDRVKLVCVHHVSNILGWENPIKEIAARVHRAGALICVDGVAYAPHRAIDVQDWDVDFYVVSLYKVYGPHCSVL